MDCIWNGYDESALPEYDRTCPEMFPLQKRSVR
jgi:hypothetical protein